MLIHQLNGLTENHRLCVTRNPPPMWTLPPAIEFVRIVGRRTAQPIIAQR